MPTINQLVRKPRKSKVEKLVRKGREVLKSKSTAPALKE